MFDFTKEQILAALKNGTKASATEISDKRIAEMKENPLLREAFASLEACREFYRGRPLYAIPFSLFKRFEADGDRRAFEHDENGYFMRRGHLKTWALSALFSGEADDISRLEDILWAICDEYTWCLPAHMNGKESIYANYQPDRYTIDLFAAETGQAIAEILQICGDKLDPLVVQRAKRELMTRVLNRYLHADSDEFFWSRIENNWAAVCAGAVGMAAICALDDETELAAIIEKTMTSMRSFIRGFSEDGVCLEGITYWEYGFGYFAAYADMLYRRTGGTIDLFDNEKTRLVALFPAKIFFYGSRTVSFSGGESRGSLSLGRMSLLKSHYPDLTVPKTAKLTSHLELEGCHRFAFALREFIWVGSELPLSDGKEHRVYPFPDAQWYVANGANELGFAARAGKNNESHNHNDVGHFILYKKGIEFFADLGAGVYTKQYFGKDRYSFVHCGSHGHSVPIINGLCQEAGKYCVAKDVSVTKNGISMDLASVYPDESLLSLRRDFHFSPEAATVSLTDRFTFTKAPRSLVERFVTSVEPIVSDGAISFSLDGVSVSMRFIPEAFDVTVLPQEDTDHRGKPIRFWFVDLTVKAPKSEMEFSFTIA